MSNGVPGRTAISHQSSNIGFSAFTALLVAAMPKCPLCWMALAGALGLGSALSVHWLRPLAVALMLLSAGALFVRARRRRRGYGPFFLGVAAAVAMYLCKFSLGYDLGVYLSAAALLGASIWNALPARRTADAAGCRC